jgi:hypothetical protein
MCERYPGPSRYNLLPTVLLTVILLSIATLYTQPYRRLYYGSKVKLLRLFFALALLIVAVILLILYVQ